MSLEKTLGWHSRASNVIPAQARIHVSEEFLDPCFRMADQEETFHLADWLKCFGRRKLVGKKYFPTR